MVFTRPRIFTQEEKDKVIDMSLNAFSTKKILEIMRCEAKTYYENRIKDPVFDKLIKEARITATETLSDELLTATDDCHTMSDAAVVRIKSENLKSVLAYRNPQTYGQRVDLNVQHTVDISAALLAAENRVIPLLEQRQMLEMGKIEAKETTETVNMDETAETSRFEDLL